MAAIYWSADQCLYDIKNINGQILCTSPPGTYLQTCKGTNMRNAANTYNGANVLWANCENANGQWVVSQLANAFDCLGGDIANENGVLTCHLPGNSGNTVQGGGRTAGNPNAVSGGQPSCGPEGANLPGCVPY